MRTAQGLRAASCAPADAAQGPAVPRHVGSHVEGIGDSLLMNDLNGGIFFEPELAELDPKARALDAAEWCERLDGPVIVHPGCSAFQPRRDGLGLIDV